MIRACALLLLAASAVFAALPAGAALAATGGTAASVPVEAEPVARRDIERYVTYYGVLQPRTTVELTMQVGGRVVALPADVGDRVAAGDALLRLDTLELEAQVRQAEAGYLIAKSSLERLLSGATAEELAQVRAAVAQAEVQYQNAQAEFDRTARLFASGSISRQAYDGAEAQLQIAKSQLDSARARLEQVQRGASAEDIAVAEAQVMQAQAALDLARAQLDKAVLRSPIAGVVSRRSINVGETAAPGSPVFSVADLEELSLRLRALGRDVIYFKTGAPVRVVVEEDPALTFEGRLHRINPVADPVDNLFQVEVRLDNADRRLTAGFFAAAHILVESASNVLAVPERAIVRRPGGEEGVYVVRDGRAVFVPVQFGTGDGRTYREAVSGLEEGELVVTRGKEYLTDGIPVEVLAR